MVFIIKRSKVTDYAALKPSFCRRKRIILEARNQYEAVHARLSLFMSKCLIVGNLMPWLNFLDYRLSLIGPHKYKKSEKWIKW